MTQLASAGGLQRIARLPFLAPLRVRDFRLVWFGEGVSLLGDQFHFVALSWLVLGLTGSGLALGTVLLAAAIPRGLFVLIGGVLSDRVAPRTLMLVSNVVRAGVTAVIATLVLTGRIELVYLILGAIVFGTVDAIFFPAISTIVARIVPENRLAPANAVMQGTHQATHAAGPAIAGFAIAFIGVGVAFVIDAVSFMVAAFAVWLVGRGAQPDVQEVSPGGGSASEDTIEPAPTHAATPPSIFGSLLEGARTVLGDPVMRILVLLSTALNVALSGPTVVGLPWLVQIRFGLDASTLGLLLASLGVGSVLGVVAAGVLPRRGSLGGVTLLVAAVLGVALALIGTAPVPVIAVLLMVIGSGTGYLNVSIFTWAQARTDPSILGRTMSFLMLGSVVGAPISMAIAALLVDTKATGLFLGAGVLILVTVIAGLGSGLHRRMM